jgi:hypothetical protein
VLDPEQNTGFVDTYLGLPFDLSACLFVATANRGSDIPPPLLDRLEVVQLGGYMREEKVGGRLDGAECCLHGSCKAQLTPKTSRSGGQLVFQVASLFPHRYFVQKLQFLCHPRCTTANAPPCTRSVIAGPHC